MAEVESKIADLRQRIAKERKILEGYQSMKAATANLDVQKSCEAKIKESSKSIGYFEDSLEDLLSRRASLPPAVQPKTSLDAQYGQHALPTPPREVTAALRRSHDSSASIGRDRQRPNYSGLDLIKADTPLTAAKISRMLHTIEFKLSVEAQYREGIEKMVKLYQADGDRKSRQDAESRRIESQQKMALLKAAMKRYQRLDVMGDVDDDDTGEDNKPTTRRPLSGTLTVNVIQARDLDRPPKRGKAKSESVVVVKVEDTPRARTHPSRNDKWNEEFEIMVDKANEVEVTIYDKTAGERPVPVGILWIRLSDIAESLRRKKANIGMDAPAGWVTAGRVSSTAPMGSAGGMDVPMGQPPIPLPQGPSTGSGSEGIQAWFGIEPEGAIELNLNFAKTNARKRPNEGGLGRQGAVRKRKEEVHEQNGHKFIAKQFIAVVLCAYCRQFLKDGSGMQCEECSFTCHAKCYPFVVTKCISRSNADSERDEDKINHRIPHRFEPLSSLLPSWCCHCGMVMPLSSKRSRKCSECDVTAHADCVHLVPDFCGMTMERASALLLGRKQIDAQTKSRHSTGQPLTMQRPTPPADNLADSTSRMRLQTDERRSQPLPPAPIQRPPQLSYPSNGSASGYGDRTSSMPPGPPSPIRDRPPPAIFPVAAPSTSRPLPSTDGNRQGVPHTSYGPRPPPPGAAPSRPDLFPSQQPQQQPAAAQAPFPPRQPAYPVPATQPQRQPMPQYNVAPPVSIFPTESRQAAPPVERKRRKVGLDDFNFLAVLGKGNFGKVMLAEEKRSNKLFAIKVLKKDFIIENDEVESTKSEKRVFLVAAKERHPFLLGLHSCFQTETRVYFVMEYVSGGDLMLHIQREQFTPRRAKFYAAEVCLALAYFHANGIIYRDLKLDNILLTLDGHVKIADYGLCKEEMWYGNTTSTFCGTPEFMAPEILLEQRYGRAVDWWAFGVLIYEMLLGQSPFRGDDEDEIFDAILEDEPLYPIHMPRDSVSILQKLLTRDPNRRLGAGQEDAAEVQRHAFFKDVNWKDMLQKKVPPPFYPSIKSATDTSNFDSEFTNEQPTLTPVHSQLSSQDQQEFASFSWVAPDI